MKTFTEVDGTAYPGTLDRSRRHVWGPGYAAKLVLVSYLSAELPNEDWVSIEWMSDDEASAPTADQLRDQLRPIIRKRLDGRLVVH